MKSEKIKILIVGFGLIGQERFKSITNLKKKGRNIELIGVFDPFFKDQDKFIKEHKINFVDNLKSGFELNPDWVFVATPHDDAVKITKIALKKDFNVLVEKPLGRNYKEAMEVFKCVERKDQLWVGFNYRFFEGINQALRDLQKGKFGNLISINILMGHGGKPEDKQTWKLDPIKAGGGCLIDPGIHLLDICSLIFNHQIEIQSGLQWKGFWKTGIEEETHFLFKSKNAIINFQVSVVKWRSTFRMEINGDKGYGIINGRNRSYGEQKYITGERWGWQKGGKQDESEKIVCIAANEDSFEKEIDALLFAKKAKNEIKPCSGKEAVALMKLLDDCREMLKK